MSERNLERPKTETQDDEFEINPETGMIISHGHEYANNPRLKELIRRANRIRESLPPPEDHVRLWRGNRVDEVGKNPSFTSSLEGIALPFLRQYQGQLSYVDVPRSDLDKYGVDGHPSEFTLSAELAKAAQAIEEPSIEN